MTHAAPAAPPVDLAENPVAGFLRLLNRVGTLCWVELRKIRHDRTELYTRAIQPALWLLIYGEVFTRVHAIPTPAGIPYLAYLAPGIMAQSALFIAIFYGIQIIWERDAGVLTKLISEFSLIPKDFVPGHRPGTLQVGPVRLADAICFEVADDAVVRQAVNGGGRLLVVQTNNASYEHQGDSGRGGETAQQLAISRLRAIESGRAAVVVATSGVSAMIAPDGRVMARTGVFRPAVLDMRVPLRDPRTVADRIGAWPEWVLSGAALLALVLALVQSRGRRTDSGLDLDLRVTDQSTKPTSPTPV